MMHGRNNGKKLMAASIVKHAFDIVNLLTDQNPVQVLVESLKSYVRSGQLPPLPTKITAGG